MSASARSPVTPEGVLVAALLLFLLCGVLYPLLQVLSVALLDGGWPSLRPLAAFVVAIELMAVGIWAAPHLASRSGSALFRA